MTPPLEKWLAEVEKRSELATKGPWIGNDNVVHAGDTHICNIYDGEYIENTNHNDGPFIAHSRTDLPLLVKLLRKSLEQRDETLINHIGMTLGQGYSAMPIIEKANQELTQIITEGLSDTLGAE